MKKEELNKYISLCNISTVDAMKKIDKNAHGILFLTNKQGELVGCLTDGDIRRWLINTGQLPVDVKVVMKTDPMYLFQQDIEQANSIMCEKEIKALPILDSKKKIIDVVLKSNQIITDSVESSKDGLENVPVIIMAGGKGTRLYPFTKILPKPLIPIGDIPIVERIINRFNEYGVHQFYLTTNYKKGMIKSYFSDLNPEYEINYVEENKPLGTAGSIKLITQKFESPVFITNCDILIDANYDSILKYHKESGNVLTIVSALKNIKVPYGVLHFKEKGVITSMEEKPSLSYFINTGMYVLNPELIQEIPDDTFYHMTNLAEKLMEKNMQVGMYPVSEESFLDMGEFEEMRRMEEKLDI